MKRKKAKAKVIKLRVEVEDLGETFVIACGLGQQNIKWLALVVSQRIGNTAPKGARRSKDSRLNKFNTHSSSLVPGEILINNVVADPLMSIKEAVSAHNAHGAGDGEMPRVSVRFFEPGAASRRPRTPKGPTPLSTGLDMVQYHHMGGVPSQYFSPFAQRAFYTKQTVSLTKQKALTDHLGHRLYDDEHITTRYERTVAARRERRGEAVRKVGRADVMASRYRTYMATQSDLHMSQGGEKDEERSFMNEHTAQALMKVPIVLGMLVV